MNKTTLREFFGLFSPSKLHRYFWMDHLQGIALLLLLLLWPMYVGMSQVPESNGKNFKSWTWQEINPDADWSARAGLQALYHQGAFYVLGGRTPIPSPVPGASIIWGDVWKSDDLGLNWTLILPTNPEGSETHWSNRAYFQALNEGEFMYVLGGQNFILTSIPNPGCDQLGLPPGVPCPLPDITIPESIFFNDVWRSSDGISWTEMTAGEAPENRWSGRAGLSAVVFKGELYIMGGSQNDDCSVLPPGSCPPGAPPPRIYFNDVWKSADGKVWNQVTASAPWAPRAGGVSVVKDGYIYMIGGEYGFTCPPFEPNCDPPYFNDVWRSKDGEDWEQMTASAAWSKRPGHQVVVAQDRLVLFGGFGLGEDNGITPSNPADVWISQNGKVWNKVSDSPWNAEGSEDIKYDFDALVIGSDKGKRDVVYTFGGDRETFDFSDQTNYLRVDNDVWTFGWEKDNSKEVQEDSQASFFRNYPNPFAEKTALNYFLEENSMVRIEIFDQNGQKVRTLVNEMQNAGEYHLVWDGLQNNGKPAKPGFYYASFISGSFAKTIRLFLN